MLVHKHTILHVSKQSNSNNIMFRMIELTHLLNQYKIFPFSVAVTGYDNGEFNNYECHSTAFSQNLGAPYSTYDPNCHTFGMHFGTCITNNGYCP